MTKVIITGACGFIGTCLAQRLMDMGVEVVGIDNLSRRGSELNAMELTGRELFSLHRLDLSNTHKTLATFSSIGPVDAVFHLAGQVAVTVSYRDRLLDFQDNASASFNVIEAVKRYSPEAYCLYASTNKVYGHIEVAKPVGMDFPLNPYTPYGVSKAVGEMYFTEYGRPEIGLDTICFRQSCIYGHHQFGVEDQGWLAWFAIANLLNEPITIYGDGKQVRDLLFVEDLIDLYIESWQHRLTGVYPVGGGESNALDLMEGLNRIEKTTGKHFKPVVFDQIRAGDQPYFVADLCWLADTDLRWRPAVDVDKGLSEMIGWIADRLDLVKKVLG
jgi:CDP-paratose 2-epimerase